MTCKILIPILLVIPLINGCSITYPTYAELNQGHVSANFDERIIDDIPWSIDANSFFIAHRLEIFPYMGKEQTNNWTARVLANFYPTFSENSESLMQALFGQESAGDQSKRITLSVKILTIKCGHDPSAMDAIMWSSDMPLTITTQFTLTELETGKILAQVVTEGNKSSGIGGALNLRPRAHKRANDAINMAFQTAQTELLHSLKGAEG